MVGPRARAARDRRARGDPAGVAALKRAATRRDAIVRVGTAGWSLPAAHAQAFPSDGSHLERYAARFDGVEVNSSFYRSHRTTTWARWAASVPDPFRFAVKLPRALTHEARMRAPGAVLDAFASEVSGLGHKLGPLLLQTPPGLAREARVAAAFFAALRARFDGPIAFEPRHASWFTPAAEALLARHDVSRVGADPPRCVVDAVPAGSTRLAYWRLHGTPRIYYSDYDDATISAMADALRAARRTHAEAWCIFDNTAHGHATGDALDLVARLRD